MAEGTYFVHQSSCVDDDVEIGEGTKIWYFCHVLRGARIGKECIIGQNVCIESGVVVGNRCKIQNNVSVYKGVTLEDEVFCGPSCVFTNVYNPRAFVERKHEFLPTLVKRGATIGANATVVCGATIGRYALVGAGALVKESVPDYAVVVGVPARQIGWACKCGTTLKFEPAVAAHSQRHRDRDRRRLALPVGGGETTCEYCGNEYRIKKGVFEAIKEK